MLKNKRVITFLSFHILMIIKVPNILMIAEKKWSIEIYKNITCDFFFDKKYLKQI